MWHMSSYKFSRIPLEHFCCSVVKLTLEYEDIRTQFIIAFLKLFNKISCRGTCEEIKIIHFSFSFFPTKNNELLTTQLVLSLK